MLKISNKIRKASSTSRLASRFARVPVSCSAPMTWVDRRELALLGSGPGKTG